MALTRELITQQSALSGLTDEQINAITTLSTNDEDAVIGRRIGEIYRNMDDTIAQSLGIQRNGDEKTYNYLSRAAKEFSGKYADYDTIKTTLEHEKQENARLNKLVKDGAADKELQTKYDQISAELASTKQTYSQLQQQFAEAQKKHTSEMLSLQIDNDLKSALAGLKFKANLPKTAVDALTQTAIAAVKGMNPDYITSPEGQRLVFRDKDGGVLNNPQNQLNPYTASELLSQQLKSLGVLDEGRRQTGGGTHANPNSGNQNQHIPSIDLSNAKTPVEADEIIARELMRRGLIPGTDKFQEEMLRIRKYYEELYKTLTYNI